MKCDLCKKEIISKWEDWDFVWNPVVGHAHTDCIKKSDKKLKDRWR